jgi:hypothetical protein
MLVLLVNEERGPSSPLPSWDLGLGLSHIPDFFHFTGERGTFISLSVPHNLVELTSATVRRPIRSVTLSTILFIAPQSGDATSQAQSFR